MSATFHILRAKKKRKKIFDIKVSKENKSESKNKKNDTKVNLEELEKLLSNN